MSLQDVLKGQTGTAEKPKPLPPGNYVFMIKRHNIGASKQKQTPQIDFFCVATEALGDVDQSSLAEVKNWNTREIKFSTWPTEDALWRLDKFLVDCGINDKLPREQTIPMTTGRQFVGTVSHSNGPQGQVYANITDTAPLQG